MASTLGNVVKVTIEKATLHHPGRCQQPIGLRLKSQFTFKVTYRVACDKRGGIESRRIRNESIRTLDGSDFVNEGTSRIVSTPTAREQYNRNCLAYPNRGVGGDSLSPC